MVQVIDFESLMTKQAAKVQAEFPGATLAGKKVGLVAIGDETFFVTEDGIIITEPVENIHDNPISVPVTMTTPSTKEGDEYHSSFEWHRYHPIHLFAENIGSFPIKSEEPLQEFIRTFGSRLDANYADIKKFLENRKQEVNHE